jgi:hypothetical protein
VKGDLTSDLSLASPRLYLRCPLQGKSLNHLDAHLHQTTQNFQFLVTYLLSSSWPLWISPLFCGKYILLRRTCVSGSLVCHIIKTVILEVNFILF